ncbi:MAG TPA: twin-arginine translocation signal domain-containing protein [Burkholderiales bacterium]|nr:twin-arginine translocation signal domain-containing protein [Burkholderiales bacterium]
MNNQTKSRASRRNFLIAAGAGGVAAVVAVGGRSTQGPEVVTSSDKRRGKGYEETAHVRRYYNTTKV